MTRRTLDWYEERELLVRELVQAADELTLGLIARLGGAERAQPFQTFKNI